MRISKALLARSAALLLLVVTPVWAQTPATPTVEMETTSASVGIGGQSGQGQLYLPNLGSNCVYPFTVNGFGAGIQVGVSKAAAAGNVLNLRRISDLGVPVYTIALGTQTGVIDSPDNPGTPFPVPPDEETLRQVARMTDGQFFSAPSAADLQAVYDNIGSRVGVVHEPREITSAFAAAGALLLALGSAFALVFFNRFP